MKKKMSYKLKTGIFLTILFLTLSFIVVGGYAYVLNTLNISFFSAVRGAFHLNPKEKETKKIPGLKSIPSFSLKRSDGSVLTEKNIENSVTIVHFWASWCAPCVPEITEILTAAKKLPKDKNGKPIYWLFISQDESFEKAKKVLKDEMLTENVISVLDKDAVVSDLFGSYQFPETYLVTREGGILTKWVGAQEWSGNFGDKVIKEIDELSVIGTGSL